MNMPTLPEIFNAESSGLFKICFLRYLLRSRKCGLQFSAQNFGWGDFSVFRQFGSRIMLLEILALIQCFVRENSGWKNFSALRQESPPLIQHSKSLIYKFIFFSERGVAAVEGVNITRVNVLNRFLGQRNNASYSWDKNTPRAITALFLAKAAFQENNTLEEGLMAKQLELQTSVALLRFNSSWYLNTFDWNKLSKKYLQVIWFI